MESKSKSTLQPRKEVTVVPPEQYKQRFCREVCDYFIAVPGKKQEKTYFVICYQRTKEFYLNFYTGKFDRVTPSNTLPSLLI